MQIRLPSRWISASRIESAWSPARLRASGSRRRGCSRPKGRASSSTGGTPIGPSRRGSSRVPRSPSPAIWRSPAPPRSSSLRRREALGPVECLVNNVGEAYQVGFEELTDEQWDAMWQLNVMSYVRCIRAVLPGMKEAGGGDDRQRLVDRREATVDRDAELLGDEGGGALALPSRCRPLRQARHPLQRRRARPDGYRRVARRRGSGGPAGSVLY